MKRGDIYWMNVKSEVKHVNTGNRQVLVISNNKCNEFSSVITVVPLTSENKKYLPTHVETYLGNIKNTILCEQIISINKSEIIVKSKICSLSKDTMDRVSLALMKQIGIMEV